MCCPENGDTMYRRLWRGYMHTVGFKEKMLRAIMPARMHFVHYSWPLRADLCPCDVDFCDYLRERNIRRQSIFHFGTGGHHLVGLRNHADGLENDILGLTVAPKEHAGYVSKVIRDPGLALHYKVLFADIFSLGGSSLPVFNIVTLLHLGEFSDAAGRGRRLNVEQVLQLFCTKLLPGGLMLFYTRSYGYPNLRPLLESAQREARLSLVETHKSLEIYRVT
jgi:hypothetical protein